MAPDDGGTPSERGVGRALIGGMVITQTSQMRLVIS
jgi:hypothetical protein